MRPFNVDIAFSPNLLRVIARHGMYPETPNGGLMIATNRELLIQNDSLVEVVEQKRARPGDDVLSTCKARHAGT